MSAPAETEFRAPGRERLLHSTTVVATMTLLSRILGLVRDIALSNWFGAGLVMDAFTVAFKIPNMLRRFFAEGAFSQAFVPVIAEYRATRTAAETRELIDRAAGTLGAMVLVATVIGTVAAPVLILIYAPGFFGDGDRYQSATAMLRFTFPYLTFISFTALSGSILNAHQRFAAAAFTPVLFNVVLITFAGWVDPKLGRPGLGLALGVFTAGVVQLAFQLPFLAKLGVLPRPRWGWAHEGVRRILRLMLPAILGSSVAQISLLLDTLIASFLAAGSLSWLYYSDRLVEFPLGVLGIAAATVILPRLAEHHSRASGESFAATLDWALRLVVVVGVPAALGLALLAKPLMTTLFYRGEFDVRDVDMAGASLVAYAPGLVGFILVKVLAPGYFARQDTRTPVRTAIQALALSMILNIVFVLVLVRTGWAPPHAGIAAATTCSGLFNSALLLTGLLRSGIYRPRPGWRRLGLQVAASSLVMGVVLVVGIGEIGSWLALGRLARVLALTACVGGGALVYLGTAYLLGLRPATLRVGRAAVPRA